MTVLNTRNISAAGLAGAANPAIAGANTGAPGARGADTAYLQELQAMNQQMQRFTLETTRQEMDMKKFNNAERAIQGGIQSMPA